VAKGSALPHGDRVAKQFVSRNADMSGGFVGKIFLSILTAIFQVNLGLPMFY